MGFPIKNLTFNFNWLLTQAQTDLSKLKQASNNNDNQQSLNLSIICDESDK